MAHTEMIKACTQALIDRVEELTALDAAIGDGDHGLNMKRGSLAIQAKLADFEQATLNQALAKMGTICMATVGGSSGPVFGTLLITLSKNLPESPKPEDWSRALEAGVEALKKLGKVDVGQKTLLDVLVPVQKELQKQGDDVVSRVRVCANESAEATANIPAIKGRASFLGDRALGKVDPGSRSMAILITTICDHL
jgi:dihydroxyacetone kinase-like protein